MGGRPDRNAVTAIPPANAEHTHQIETHRKSIEAIYHFTRDAIVNCPDTMPPPNDLSTELTLEHDMKLKTFTYVAMTDHRIQEIARSSRLNVDYFLSPQSEIKLNDEDLAAGIDGQLKSLLPILMASHERESGELDPRVDGLITAAIDAMIQLYDKQVQDLRAQSVTALGMMDELSDAVGWMLQQRIKDKRGEYKIYVQCERLVDEQLQSNSDYRFDRREVFAGVHDKILNELKAMGPKTSVQHLVMVFRKHYRLVAERLHLMAKRTNRLMHLYNYACKEILP